ncbi:O-acetylhomoserine aminocarboxypropyltransferase/cysteine synthase family protein [Pseudonocardia hispaniensis]|uniref:O-acetylhomoserine aminocarboxypropyltransferase/cysteine synthase family protein n=1 Tax=Pseudonocardia hispaniensis TaxID=904933 RepID=A0ABW1J7D0_9PSEU
MEDRQFGMDTLAVHAGQRPDPVTGCRTVPIYQTGAYVFEDTNHAANLFSLQRFGNVYSRIMNPTTAVFEERVAALEKGIGAVATASGQAGQHLALFTLMEAGDEFVSSRTLYGGSFQQFDVSFRKVGINARFVDASDLNQWKAAVTPNTKAFYAEVMGNPTIDLVDIEPLADLAHEVGVPLIIDNTFASPYLCNPLEWGADIVLHSATKFICGHGTALGGVIVDAGRFPWDNGKFPGMTEPAKGYNNLKFFEYFGDFSWLLKCRAEMLRDYGPMMAPQVAWLMLQGLETLHVRMERHVRNAQTVAEFLEQHPDVEYVNYPGLKNNPYHELSKKYLPKGAGSIFTFGIKGGREAGRKFIEAVQLFSHLANVGDAKSLVIHPASTTHQQLSDDDLRSAGIGPEMIRVSIGIEDVDDIIWDLDQALAAAKRPGELAALPRDGAEQNGLGHSIMSKAFGAPFHG